MSTERWAEDYGLTPEEAAAIAADDALLDALGSRSVGRDDLTSDPAARMLASWVAELDLVTADDARATSVKLAMPAVAVRQESAPATVSSLSAHRAKSLLAAGVVVTGLLLPGGVAAAAGYSPATPYRSVITSVFGEAPEPATDARTRLDEVKAAMARGDAEEAARLLAALKASVELGADPELDGLISDVEDQIGLATPNNGKANAPASNNGNNGNPAPGSNAGGNGQAQSNGNKPATNPGKALGNGKPTEAPGRVKSSPVASVPPGSANATPPAAGGSVTAPGKSGTAGDNGNGKKNN